MNEEFVLFQENVAMEARLRAKTLGPDDEYKPLLFMRTPKQTLEMRELPKEGFTTQGKMLELFHEAIPREIIKMDAFFAGMAMPMMYELQKLGTEEGDDMVREAVFVCMADPFGIEGFYAPMVKSKDGAQLGHFTPCAINESTFGAAISKAFGAILLSSIYKEGGMRQGESEIGPPSGGDLGGNPPQLPEEYA